MKNALLKNMILMVCIFLPTLSATSKELASATLKGNIADPSNAAIAGVAVYLRSLPDGPALHAVSDEQGRYIFRGLAPGAYELSLTVEGFEPFSQTDLALREGESLQLPIQLEILHQAENMTVRAKAPPREYQLETREHNHEEILEIREARESGAKDVGEALSKLEGTWKIRKAGIANDIVLRGFQQDNLNIIVDGMRIYGACPSNMDPGPFHVDFAEIEQVNVIKGPFSVREQGSLGGVISLKSPALEEGLKITPRISAGSFSFYNPSLSASLSKGRFSGVGGYSYRSSDPYVDGSGQPFTAYSNYKNAGYGMKAFDIGTYWAKMGTSITAGDHLQLAYARQNGGRVLYPGLSMDGIYDDADRLNATYNSRQFTGFVKQFQIESYFTDVRHLMTNELRTSSMGMSSLAATKVLGTRVEAQIAGITAGFEGYKRNWDTTAVPNVNQLMSGFYAEYQKSLRSRLMLHAGARLDHTADHARSVGSANDLYWAYNNTRTISQSNTYPSGNVWLTYSFTKGMDLFVGAGSSARLPDPQERYFVAKRMGTDWVGNPNLKPTRNNEIDLGINYRGHRIYLRPTLFYSDLDDYITVHNQPKVNMVMGVMNNAARSYEGVKAKMYGGEVSYSVGLSDDLLWLGGLSYARGIKDLVPTANILDRDLAEMPPLKSRMALRYGRKKLFWEIEGLAVNAQNQVDSDLKEQKTPGYFTLNFKAGIHFEKMRFTAGIDNLLNRYYYESFSYQRDPFRSGVRIPEPGRTLYIAWNYLY